MKLAHAIYAGLLAAAIVLGWFGTKAKADSPAEALKSLVPVATRSTSGTPRPSPIRTKRALRRTMIARINAIFRLMDASRPDGSEPRCAR